MSLEKYPVVEDLPEGIEELLSGNHSTKVSKPSWDDAPSCEVSPTSLNSELQNLNSHSLGCQ